MTTAMTAHATEQTTSDRHGTLRLGTLRLALVLVVAVIGFEQFLHTSPAAQTGSPGYEVMYWLSDALFAAPLAVFAVWAGGRIADHWDSTSRRVWSVFARAAVITSVFAIALIPGWFLHDTLDSLAHTAAVEPGHAGHSNGGGDEVHWAGDTVFRILVLVPLAAAALWGGEHLGGRVAGGRDRAASVLVRVGLIAALLTGALASAWFLEVAADAADSDGVTYTNVLGSGHVRPSVVSSHNGAVMPYMGPISAAASNKEAPLAASVAHALRDGLAGQAVGLPVMFLVLLWCTGTRRSDRRGVVLTAKEESR